MSSTPHATSSQSDREHEHEHVPSSESLPHTSTHFYSTWHYLNHLLLLIIDWFHSISGREALTIASAIWDIIRRETQAQLLNWRFNKVMMFMRNWNQKFVPSVWIWKNSVNMNRWDGWLVRIADWLRIKNICPLCRCQPGDCLPPPF